VRCERPKMIHTHMIGWSLSQAGAPEMGISEEGAASCCMELPSYACCSQQDDCADVDDGWRSASAMSMVSKRRIESEESMGASGEESEHMIKDDLSV
jgi:hypothetical protein